MKPALRIAFALSLFLSFVPLAFAQNADAKKEPPSALISIYRIAPGKHLDFLKWMAAREAADKEAGLPASQLYAHRDGASWDYILIAPDLNDEQQKKSDAVAAKKGLTTGFKAHLEIRTMLAEHSDTFATGPVTAAELVAAATAK
jgi:hypothetical protein